VKTATSIADALTLIGSNARRLPWSMFGSTMVAAWKSLGYSSAFGRASDYTYRLRQYRHGGWPRQSRRNRLFHQTRGNADELASALLAPTGCKAEAPMHPMSANHVRWEHIQNMHELCGCNVSETARRLRMHRRTL
jgi:hypothetical protein